MIQRLPAGYETLSAGNSAATIYLSDSGNGLPWRAPRAARFGSNLDEPSSNLDSQAEYELFMRCRDLARGRTTILVSHRFSTVRIAERIVVMERGRIVEMGSHEELLRKAGYYTRLYDRATRSDRSASA